MKDKQLAYFARTWDYILNQTINLEQNACAEFLTADFQIGEYDFKAIKDFRYYLENAINIAWKANNRLKDPDFEPEI